MSVSLRPERPEDRDFLCSLYASTRQEELAAVDWPPEAIAAFLASQFEHQSRHYAEHYADTAFLIVEADGAPIGRLYLARWADEFRVVDIALVPERRGRGVGGELMGGVLREADATGLPVRIHVEKFNPALRFYERLGFREIEDKGVYLFMERRPGGEPR